mgnify:CR=1 FL=1
MSESIVARWSDFLELTKPRVVALMLLTALIGMCMAVPGLVPWEPLVYGNLGIGLCAGAAAAINHVVDERIDQEMSRTTNRPVAQGRVSQTEALVFAALLAISGTVLLAVTVNVLTALLTVASLVGYAFVYTMFLKRATPQNIVIGGLAGAAPPLLGWTAVTGEIHGHGLLLVLIIFAWTPPHFWALAIHRKEEYAKADIPMLPVTHGDTYTKINIVLYTLMLIVVTIMPYLTGLFGWLYLAGCLILGAGFLFYSALMWLNKDSGMRTFKYSILYLMLLFVIMLLDHYLVQSVGI